MKISEEYRALALDALRGKWKTAVLAGIIASAFGANIVSGSSSITSRSNQDSSFSMPGEGKAGRNHHPENHKGGEKPHL